MQLPEISFPAFDEMRHAVNMSPERKALLLLKEVMDNHAALPRVGVTLDQSLAYREAVARQALARLRALGLAPADA